MRSATPKVLHPICGREIVGIVVDNVLDAGLGPVVVVTPPDGDGIRNALGDSVLYAEQSKPLGTGHAANQARDLLPDEETIVMLAGDIPLVGPKSLQKLVQRHAVSGAVLTVLTSTLTDPAGLGRVVRSGGWAHHRHHRGEGCRQPKYSRSRRSTLACTAQARPGCGNVYRS